MEKKKDYKKKRGIDALNLGRALDRRIKLAPERYPEVRAAYDQLKSQRKVASLFGVSRRLITFILDPEKRATAARQFIERRMDGRYKVSKEKWAATMQEHRNYKRKVLNYKGRGDANVPQLK